MNELEMIGWLVSAGVLLVTFVYSMNRPFKEQKEETNKMAKEQKEETRKLEKRMYQLHDEIKKEAIASNKELTHSINELTSTMRLFKQTFENFQFMFQKQEEINDEVELELSEIKDAVKDIKHNCQMMHRDETKYYKDREP